MTFSETLPRPPLERNSGLYPSCIDRSLNRVYRVRGRWRVCQEVKIHFFIIIIKNSKYFCRFTNAPSTGQIILHGPAAWQGHRVVVGNQAPR
jgi:hypothetical protein